MILITGGLGFFGCSLAHYLARQGERVLLTRHRRSRVPTFLEPLIDKQVWITPCDVLDPGSLSHVLESYRVKSIIHAAGTPGHKGDLYHALNVNILGTMNVLEAAHIKNIGKLLYTGTQSVYARGEIEHHEEEDLPLRSLHAISLSKKAGDMICDYYGRQYDMAITITRPCQIYGPLYITERNPLQRMVEDAVAGKATDLPDVAPNDGNNLMYVKDCVRALAMIHLKEKPDFPIYNVGDKYFHNGEMAEAVRRIIPTAEIRLGPNRANAPGRMLLNTDRLRNEFRFAPEYDLEAGIRDYIRWLRNGEY